MATSPDADAPEADPAVDPESELEAGLDHLGKAVGGVLTRLLGPRYTKVELDPERPVLGAEADRAVERAGDRMGRWLRATGDGLKAHPTDPIRALDHAAKHKDEDVEVREGEAPFAAGARALASGLYRSTEAVLDVVAPRRSRGDGAEDAPADAGDPGEEE
ncbi:MAG: hypothetical protein H6742_10550 [Alphaproteobacteria bacterium]|nr:hypothetical protein [Alphaproteobacteria bacterium]